MEQNQTQNMRRKLLNLAVSAILIDVGFDTADRDVLETLTEFLQCYLCELGRISKSYAEIAGRTEPVIADVILGFINMGINFNGLEQYVKSSNHTNLPSLQTTHPLKQTSMLQAGTKLPLPGHIPNYLPSFPDPHAYIRTPTHKQPVIDYEAIREKSAIQKKDMEKALTKFLAKTSETHNLFDQDDANMFPLIACKAQFPPYLAALLPQDQIFDPEDLEYDHKNLEEQNQAKKKLKTEEKINPKEEDDAEEIEENAKPAEDVTPANWDIDNPYLAATKLPAKMPGD